MDMPSLAPSGYGAQHYELEASLERKAPEGRMEECRRAPGSRATGSGVVMILFIVAVFSAGCTGPSEDPRPSSGGPVSQSIDERSYHLGSIGAFAEMVGAGVKRLALSAPMDPGEVNGLLEEAQRIAAEHGVGLYLEEDFLVTDLFSPELTEGKHVLVICMEATWQEYLEIKRDKARLEAEGLFQGEARTEIARRFGGLLSYPEAKIEALLETGRDGNAEGPR